MMTRLEQVQAFWDANPCGSQAVSAEIGSLDFFLEYECYRYTVEPHI